jgi:hypothetical protein
VAVIHHRYAPWGDQNGYLLSLLARSWMRDGIDVHHLYGIDTFVPADIAVLHVDLSLVPQAYSDFARRYPVALNTSALDIRKRSLSSLLVSTPVDYQGPVIVKTDLNCGGIPERYIHDQMRAAGDVFEPPAGRSAAHRINSPAAYTIYPTAAAVPPEYFRDPRLVVEKFVPERRGDNYCHRRYYFLGETEVNQLWHGTKPICAYDDDGVASDAPIPAELQAFRRRFGIEYGKIDYVLSDTGKVIVFDVNKTPAGACRNPAHWPWLQHLCASLQGGLYGLLLRQAATPANDGETSGHDRLSPATLPRC